MLKTVGNPSTRYGNQTILDGNLVIGTAGKGIDFSADPSAAGMTSELLDDYEEGTWTPVFNGVTVTYITQTGTYTKVGNLVYADCILNIASIDNTDTSPISIGGLPFASALGQRGLANVANFFGQTPLVTTTIRNMTGVSIESSAALFMDASQTAFLTYATTCNASGRAYFSLVYRAS